VVSGVEPKVEACQGEAGDATHHVNVGTPDFIVKMDRMSACATLASWTGR